MDKKFKLICIFSLILAGLAIAWNTLVRFFSGFGVNFVAVLAIFSTVFIIAIEDKKTYSKVKDLFYVDLGIASFELLVFIMEEYFGRFGKVYVVFTIIQEIFSAFAILYFVYVVLKILFAAKGKEGCVFTNLFRSSEGKKTKKVKGLANGALEDKPKKVEDQIPVLEGQIEIDNEEE